MTTVITVYLAGSVLALAFAYINNRLATCRNDKISLGIAVILSFMSWLGVLIVFSCWAEESPTEESPTLSRLNSKFKCEEDE